MNEDPLLKSVHVKKSVEMKPPKIMTFNNLESEHKKSEKKTIMDIYSQIE